MSDAYQYHDCQSKCPNPLKFTILISRVKRLTTNDAVKPKTKKTKKKTEFCAAVARKRTPQHAIETLTRIRIMLGNGQFGSKFIFKRLANWIAEKTIVFRDAKNEN
jgi:hypothetical protein